MNVKYIFSVYLYFQEVNIENNNPMIVLKYLYLVVLPVL